MTMTAHDEAVHGDHGDTHEHPSDLTYVKIALILGVITAAEVALPFIADIEGPFIAAMVVMMVAKFAIVGLWFMHLRFDNPIFKQMFVAGMALAVGVYLAVFVSVQFFGDDTTSIPVNELPGPPPVAE